jgi:hypothetical protein
VGMKTRMFRSNRALHKSGGDRALHRPAQHQKHQYNSGGDSVLAKRDAYVRCICVGATQTLASDVSLAFSLKYSEKADVLL